MAVILEGAARMLECAGCGEMYLEGDVPSRSNERAAEGFREKHGACPVVPTRLAATAPALEADLGDLVKELAPDLTTVHARAVAAAVIDRFELGQLPGRLETATRMLLDMGRQLGAAQRRQARPGLLEELAAAKASDLQRAGRVNDLEEELGAARAKVVALEAALTSACCVGCKAVLPDLETAARPCLCAFAVKGATPESMAAPGPHHDQRCAKWRET